MERLTNCLKRVLREETETKTGYESLVDKDNESVKNDKELQYVFKTNGNKESQILCFTTEGIEK